jgi:quinol monooxygenase YgiN
MKTFMLTVTYTAMDGCARKFVNELEQSGVAAAVRAEDGCISYDYYFSAKDENSVFLFEEWESERHQQIHLTQPHIAALKEIKSKYILKTDLRVL